MQERLAASERFAPFAEGLAGLGPSDEAVCRHFGLNSEWFASLCPEFCSKRFIHMILRNHPKIIVEDSYALIPTYSPLFPSLKPSRLGRPGNLEEEKIPSRRAQGLGALRSEFWV